MTMTCCTPRLCGCPIKINDTSKNVSDAQPEPDDWCWETHYDDEGFPFEVYVPCAGGEE